MTIRSGWAAGSVQQARTIIRWIPTERAPLKAGSSIQYHLEAEGNAFDQEGRKDKAQDDQDLW